jgi:hypothetical protein
VLLDLIEARGERGSDMKWWWRSSPRTRVALSSPASCATIVEMADGEADAPVVRRVGRRAVDEAHVVQGHLTGTQSDDPPLRLDDLDHHLLAARQEIVFGERVAMGDLIELVAAARRNAGCP